MIEKFLEIVMTEYGIFVGFLLFTNTCSVYAVKILYGQNVKMSDKFLEHIKQSTKVMTQIVEKLESHDNRNY